MADWEIDELFLVKGGMELVFTTNNIHKLQEARLILGERVSLRSLQDIGCDVDIPETGDTLEQNSLQKANYIWEHYGLDCIADDTGLEVFALGGAPGVYSARYAGKEHDFIANRKKLFRELNGIDMRSAQFRTVITLIRGGIIKQVEGVVEGTITTEERGESGFGYDSMFVPKGETRSFGEMTADEKAAISHRKRALEALCKIL